jgi:hypothetical protein
LPGLVPTALGLAGALASRGDYQGPPACGPFALWAALTAAAGLLDYHLGYLSRVAWAVG